MKEDPRIVLLLALADDELIIGHRHSQWTGWAPHIEEDLAFSSIAQDEMAHARLLYGLAREAGLTDRDVDALALGRPPAEYRNAVLCERPNGDWGFTVARQYLYDTADAVRVAELAESSWPELAEIMKVIQLEEKYHSDHAVAWFQRLASGTSLTARGTSRGISITRRTCGTTTPSRHSNSFSKPTMTTGSSLLETPLRNRRGIHNSSSDLVFTT